MKTVSSGTEDADPDAGGGGFAKVGLMSADRDRSGLVVFAMCDSNAHAGAQFARIEKFQELRIFFVDSQNLHGSPDGHVRKRHSVLRAFQPRQAAAQRHAMRTGTIRAKAAHQQFDHFGRKAVLEALGGGVRQSPIEPDHIGQEFLGELVAQGQPFRFSASLTREANVAVAFHAQETIAVHALERGGHRWRRDFQFFRETRADGGLIVLLELPDGLQIIFPGDARRFAWHEGSYRRGMWLDWRAAGAEELNCDSRESAAMTSGFESAEDRSATSFRKYSCTVVSEVSSG